MITAIRPSNLYFYGIEKIDNFDRIISDFYKEIIEETDAITIFKNIDKDSETNSK